MTSISYQVKTSYKNKEYNVLLCSPIAVSKKDILWWCSISSICFVSMPRFKTEYNLFACCRSWNWQFIILTNFCCRCKKQTNKTKTLYYLHRWGPWTTYPAMMEQPPVSDFKLLGLFSSNFLSIFLVNLQPSSLTQKKQKEQIAVSTQPNLCNLSVHISNPPDRVISTQITHETRNTKWALSSSHFTTGLDELNLEIR